MSPTVTVRKFIHQQPLAFAVLTATFALALGAVAAFALASRAVAEADVLARRAHATFAAAHQLIATIQEAASAVQRHAGGSETDPLRSYQRARENHVALLEALRPRTDAGPALVLFEELQAAVNAEFAALERALDARSREGTRAALAVVDADGNRALLDDIRQLVVALQRTSFDDHARHAAGASRRAAIVQALQASVVVLAIAIIGVAATLLVRRMRRLEHWITVCSWTRRVRWQGRWVSFEDYLSNQFNIRCTHGISEEAAEQLQLDAAKYDTPADLRD